MRDRSRNAPGSRRCVVRGYHYNKHICAYRQASRFTSVREARQSALPSRQRRKRMPGACLPILDPVAGEAGSRMRYPERSSRHPMCLTRRRGRLACARPEQRPGNPERGGRRELRHGQHVRDPHQGRLPRHPHPTEQGGIAAARGGHTRSGRDRGEERALRTHDGAGRGDRHRQAGHPEMGDRLQRALSRREMVVARVGALWQLLSAMERGNVPGGGLLGLGPAPQCRRRMQAAGAAAPRLRRRLAWRRGTRPGRVAPGAGEKEGAGIHGTTPIGLVGVIATQRPSSPARCSDRPFGAPFRSPCRRRSDG